jgi:hypothetical protein
LFEVILDWGECGGFPFLPYSITDDQPTSLVQTVSHAQYSIGNFSAAVEAYTKGLELDGSNANMKASLAQAQSKAKEQEAQLDREADDDVDDDAVAPGAGAGAGGMPDLSALAGMFGGGAGGAGGAGKPGSFCQSFRTRSDNRHVWVPRWNARPRFDDAEPHDDADVSGLIRHPSNAHSRLTRNSPY